MVTVSGAAWTVNQWTTTPHLLYVKNADESEQGFLILSNTSDSVTVATNFDLVTRFAVSNTVRVVSAPTFASVFGADGGG